MALSRLVPLLCLLSSTLVNGAITVYYAPGQEPIVTPTGVAADAKYTGLAAYNPKVLIPPPVPNPKPPMQFDMALKKGETEGLSIKLSGNFMGFSIEMSVVNQILGKNSTLVQVPFLNLMAELQQRAGNIRIRVGGNTQERARFVDSGVIENGRIIIKNTTGLIGTTNTPPITVSKDLLHLMKAISSFVNVRWFVGVPFDNPADIDLTIMRDGQAILGDYLLGVQVGNEPDLYPGRRRKPEYNEFDYFGEFGDFIQLIANDQTIRNKTMLMGPSTSSQWPAERVWNTGFLDRYESSLGWVTVEHYPMDNCFETFGVGHPRFSQTELPGYLNHTSAKVLTDPYRNSIGLATSKNKPVVMFETNTASCGGFAGISDAFVAAIWGIDYALQMAAASFTGSFFHVGGQNVYYNPFTPPPTNETLFHQWTIGPIFYSALFVAEAIGPSNNTQVKDLNANGDNIFTPAYGFYENGEPVRIALINFIDDPSGASEYTARISIGGGQTGQPVASPNQVKVKYLLAKSVAQKGNFTWGGQTYGSHFESDGRLRGQEDIKTVPCENGICAVKVPAPGAALVFLNDNAFTDEKGASPTTFPTTARTRTRNTATIEASVLAMSNGNKGMAFGSGTSTSHGSGNGRKNNAPVTASISRLLVACTLFTVPLAALLAL